MLTKRPTLLLLLRSKRYLEMSCSKHQSMATATAATATAATAATATAAPAPTTKGLLVRKWGESRINKTGTYVNMKKEQSFTIPDNICEGLNNLDHQDGMEVTIKNGHSTIGRTTFEACGFEETGGSGFTNKEAWEKAITWSSSIDSGINNFGVGMKSECMIPRCQDFIVIKIDTRLGLGVVWIPGYDGGFPQSVELSKEELSGIGQENARVFRSFWGPGASSLLDHTDLVSLLEADVEFAEEDNLLLDLKRRYGDTESHIEYNGESITADYFAASRAKEQVIEGELVPMLFHDTGLLELWENILSGEYMIKFTPALKNHAGKSGPLNYDGSTSYWFKTEANSGSDKASTRRTNSWDKEITAGRFVANINMVIMWTGNNPDDPKWDTEDNIHCSIGSGIECEQRSDTRWGGTLHMRLSSDNTSWLDLKANKSRSNVKKGVMDVIIGMVNRHYVLGDSKADPVFQSAPKENIPIAAKDRLKEELKAYQNGSEYWRQEEHECSDNQAHCTACQCMIEMGVCRTKMNQCHMGHITSAASKKNASEEDDTSMANLAPVCSHCNSNMGTDHMTSWIGNKWGIKSHNYKEYVKYCQHTGKKWEEPLTVDPEIKTQKKQKKQKKKKKKVYKPLEGLAGCHNIWKEPKIKKTKKKKKIYKPIEGLAGCHNMWKE